MARALYRKYRSKKLSEVVGQEHITTTLSQALKKGQISHAYLLTGPRGVGKTSVARILAHEVNNLEYSDEDSHLDIIEIDAASNRSIEDIRNLREKAFLAPTSARYKVYIIDEVHMLSRDAFNALLKTLEEPPEHVIFVLATTELHKVPATIISRTQRFGFRPIAADTMAKHLRSIADLEKIDITDEALNRIAEHANGSFRDGLSLLDQASGYGAKIGETDVDELLGQAPAELIRKVIDHIVAGKTADALSVVSEALDDGTSPEVFASQLIRESRARLFAGDLGLRKLITDLLTSGSTNPRISLELAIYDASSNGSEPVIQSQTIETEPKAKPEVKPKETKAPKNPASNETHTAVTGAFDSDTWTRVLEKIKGQHNTLYGILRMAETSVEDGALCLGFQFPFHMKRAAEPRHKDIIADTIKQVTGQEPKLSFVKKSEKPKKVVSRRKSGAKMTDKAAGGAVEAVRDIFGGAEPL